MAEDSPQPVHIWRFRDAPKQFQQLFAEGRDYDWIVHAAESENQVVGPSLLGWRTIHPVRVVTLADGSTVFWGAPREAVASIAKFSKVAIEPPPVVERRNSARFRIECPLRYEAHSEPKRSGEGHTIDISGSGISFTSESLLPAHTKATVHIKWPIRLEGGIPIELRATGTVVRAEPTIAAIQVDETGFAFASIE